MKEVNVYLPSKSLNQVLLDIRTCLEDCFSDLTQKPAFVAMCDALTLELAGVIQHLESKIDSYGQRLPIFKEQPHDFDVEEETNLIQHMIEALMMHPFYYDVDDAEPDSRYAAPGDLRLQLEQLIDRINEIHVSLNPLERSDLFINYAKDELAQYNQRHWARQQRQIREDISRNAVRAHIGEYYEEQFQINSRQLELFRPKVISDDHKEIYLEALGHILWRNAQEAMAELEDLHEVLIIVKATEHFATLSKHEITYSEREIGDNEIEEHGATLEDIRRDRINRQLDKIRQTAVGWIAVRIGWCAAKYFQPCVTEGWIKQMLTEALSQEYLQDDIIKKLKTEGGRRKMLYQIMGELMNSRVLGKADATAMNLAKVIADKIPGECKSNKIDSASHYIRQGIDDSESLKKWVDDYPLNRFYSFKI